MITDTEGFVLTSTDSDNEKRDQLEKMEGQIISVWSGVGDRHSFSTQLSINGKLEQHQTDKDSFRVVVSAGTYAYFKVRNIITIGVKKAGFKDGSVAVIEITF